MAEKKATKSKADNKNLIIGICAAVVVVIVIIVAVVVANLNKGIDDSYFVSDGTKYVLTINTEDSDDDDSEDEAYTPAKIHQVYTYTDDTITGLKYYYEYADAKTAQAAYDYLKSEAGDDFSEITVEGKYVIATAPEDSYKDYTASDVKQQIEFMEMLKNMDTDDLDTDGTEDVEVTDEETEEEVEE